MREFKENSDSRCDRCAAFGRCVLASVGNDPTLRLPGLRKGYTFEKGNSIPFTLNNQAGFHAVRYGSAKITFSGNRARAVKIAGPGDLIGFCHENMVGHLAEAIDYTETCFCPEAEMSALVDRDPGVARRLLKHVCRENWKANSRIAGLANNSVKQRVLFILQELARDFGVPSQYGKKINVRLSRTVLGEMAGAISETLARVLTELEKEDVIVREKWAIHLRTPSDNPPPPSPES